MPTETPGSRNIERRLAAILAADVAGYSRLMEADESETVAALRAARDKVINPKIAEQGGRVVKYIGDGFLAEFGTVIDAVNCAVDIQLELRERSAAVAEDRRMDFRMGLNLGDIVVDGEDILGEGVNIAARLEALAQPGGICVSGSVYDQVKSKLDLKMNDLGPQSVKNMTEPVRAFAVTLEHSRAPKNLSTGPTDTAIFKRPAVAVMPFDNLGGDPEQEFFADGLTQDIITALSAWRSFPVISRSSTFSYKGQSLKVQQLGKELGARYIIEGSVRTGGKMMRVTVQLIDAETGHHVWADRFDRQIEDLFKLQDEIAQRIAATVEPELGQFEEKVSAANPTASQEAWGLFQRGMGLLYEYTAESIPRGRELLTQAIALDPNYSQAYSGAAYSHQLDILLGHTKDRDASKEALYKAASKAVQLDDNDSFAHMMMGFAFRWRHQHDRAIAECERSVALNPNNAWAISMLGNVIDLAGWPDEAIEKIEMALRLNPRDRHGHFLMTIIARAHLNARRYEQAEEWARKSIRWRSDHARSYLVLASALGHMGRSDEAAAALADCERVQPGFIDQWRQWQEYLDQDANDHIEDGLRKAGWAG